MLGLKIFRFVINLLRFKGENLTENMPFEIVNFIFLVYKKKGCEVATEFISVFLLSSP